VNLASLWSWLVEKDTGVLVVVGLVVALTVSAATILKLLAERRKFLADARKAEAEARAAELQEPKSDRERVRDCARNVMRCVSATVDELFATFGVFASWREAGKAELAEALRVARRFRHEQRYRVESESLIGELGALGRHVSDQSITQLRQQAASLLVKIEEKKVLVAKIELGGLTRENAAAVAAWLSELREIQVGIALLVGDISGDLSLTSDGKGKTGRATERATSAPEAASHQSGKRDSMDALPVVAQDEVPARMEGDLGREVEAVRAPAGQEIIDR
jgi:hypothetical protein